MKDLNGSSPGVRVTYLETRGVDSTVAYSTFRELSSLGNFIYAKFPTEAGVSARLHVFRNHFYERTFALNANANGYELMQLGHTGVQGQSMFGRIEENLFENSAVPQADTELVTIKSSDWIVRNNTFRNNVGNFGLRATKRVLFEGNFFLGGNCSFPSSSGVMLNGSEHWIVGNYFYKNAFPAPVGYYPAFKAPYYYSVAAFAGQVEEVADGVAGVPVARNIVIANNTFAYGVNNIHLGSFYESSSAPNAYNRLPTSIVVVNNLVRSAAFASECDPTGPAPNVPIFGLPSGFEATYVANNPIENNLISGTTTGLSGFGNPSLNWSTGWNWAHDGFVYRAIETSSTIDAADPLSAFPIVPANTSFDVGAFQLEAPFRRPLSYPNAGYKAPVNPTNLLTNTSALNAAVWWPNRLRPFSGGVLDSQIDSSATIAPDGSNQAELLREDNTLGTHSVEQLTLADPTQTHTFSVYVKAGGALAVLVYLTSTAAANNGVALRVNLANGSIDSAYANGDATLSARLVQPLGNGWCRLSITGKPTATVGSQVRAVVYLLQSPAGSPTYQGNNSSGIYVWGAQLERDVVATVLRAN
jgi:hypothetical protein